MPDAVYQLGYDEDHHHLLFSLSPEAQAAIHSPRQTRLWLDEYVRGLGWFVPSIRGRWGFGHSLIPSRRMPTHNCWVLACPLPVVVSARQKYHDITLQRRIASLSRVLSVLNMLEVGSNQQMSLIISQSSSRNNRWQVRGSMYPVMLDALRRYLFEVPWPNIRQAVYTAEKYMTQQQPVDEFQAEFNPNHRLVLGFDRSRIEVDPDLTPQATERQFTLTTNDPIRIMSLLAGLGRLAEILRRRRLQQAA